jgi:hypothetical protein
MVRSVTIQSLIDSVEASRAGGLVRLGRSGGTRHVLVSLRRFLQLVEELARTGVKRLAARRGSFLLACALAAGAAGQTRSAPEELGAGAARTALLSFPQVFCMLTERSTPFAYIGFALQIDGRVRYFKTSRTTCEDLQGSLPWRFDEPTRGPIFGEQVTLYGGAIPTRLRRENGDVYEIEPSRRSTTRSYFLPSVVLQRHGSPKYLGSNPHPELVLRECRLLTDVSERDPCLWYQAGLQSDEAICGELTRASAEECRAWIAEIRGGHVDERNEQSNACEAVLVETIRSGHTEPRPFHEILTFSAWVARMLFGAP